jgi:hypothetical protein
MGTSRLIIAAIFALLVIPWSEAIADGVVDADGETPVRYVICGLGESNCFVSARFRDFEDCERHKELGVMYCNSVSNPGTVICKKTPPDTQLAKGYCTR